MRSVAPGSLADDILTPGDTILEVNGVPTIGAADATRRLRTALATGRSALVKIHREGRTVFAAIERR